MKSYIFRGLQARRRREELGLTAAEVALVVGVSESAVCAYERSARQPRGSVYSRLCQALELSPEELREPREPDSQTAQTAA